MLSFSFIPLAFLAVLPAVVAQYEPLGTSAKLLTRSPVLDFEPLEMSTPLHDDAFSSPNSPRGTKTQQLPKAHQAIARSIKNKHQAVRLEDALTTAKRGLGSVHASVSKICSGAHKLSPPEVVQQIEPQLKNCRRVIHQCGHKIHRIPHETYPSPSHAAHKSPTVSGCGGLVSSLVMELETMINEINELAGNNFALRKMLDSHVEQIDNEISAVVHGSEIVVPGTTEHVSSIARDSIANLKSLKFKTLASAIDH